MCALSDPFSVESGACYFKTVTAPGENYACGGTYPGKSCTDTTSYYQIPCYTFEQGTCLLNDYGGGPVLQCSDDPTKGKYMASKGSADYVEACVNQ